jgi:hypothetical protein
MNMHRISLDGKIIEDAIVIENGLQEYFGIDPQTIFAQAQQVPMQDPTKDIPISESGMNPIMVPGTHPGLHYRGHKLKRHKIWLQTEYKKGLKKYGGIRSNERERRKKKEARRERKKKEARRERRKKQEEKERRKKEEERKKRKLTDFPTHIGTRWSLRKSNPTVKFTFNETNEPTTISSFDLMERSRNLEMFIK